MIGIKKRQTELSKFWLLINIVALNVNLQKLSTFSLQKLSEVL